MFIFPEELVEIDTFYDDYRQKKIETVVVVDQALLPKEKEHWGYDTVGEGKWVLILEKKDDKVFVMDFFLNKNTHSEYDFDDVYFVKLGISRVTNLLH